MALERVRLAEQTSSTKASDEAYRDALRSLNASLGCISFDLDLQAARNLLDARPEHAGIGRPELHHDTRLGADRLESSIRIRNPSPAALAELTGCSDGARLSETCLLIGEVAFSDLISAARGGRTFAMGLNLVRPGREPLAVDFHAHPVANGVGSVDTLLVVISDRSEAKEQLRKIREVTGYSRMFFDLSSIALFKHDISGVQAMYRELRDAGVKDIAAHMKAHPELVDRAMDLTIITDSNEAGLRLLGATRDDVVGRSNRRFCVPRGETFRKTVEGRFAGGGNFLRDARLVRMDGTVVPTLYCAATPPEMAEFGISIGAHIDMSERAAAQEALADLGRKLAHSARVALLGELSASIAHEVSQPLAAIELYAGAAQRWLDRPEPEPAKAAASLDRLLKQAGRASGVLVRIKSMAANRPSDRGPAPLNEIVREAAEFLEHEIQGHGARLEITESETSIRVHACPIQIQQVIINLAMNALQAMRQMASSERLVDIRVSRVGAEALIEVIDTGPGIDEEAAAKLFTTFNTTKVDGLGLGLTICRSIIEAHRGSIRGGARADRAGARFAILLPIVDEEDDEKTVGHD